MSLEEERALIRRAKAGDEAAFAALMEREQSRIYNLILRQTRDPEDAADLTQEAFLNAWRGLKGFQEESSFATWLYRLAYNLCIDHARRNKRRSERLTSVPLEDEEGRAPAIPDQRPGPHEEAERQELRELLRAGLRALSEEHRQVLVLRELEGFSYGEIARMLGLEEGTVKSRIARARLALRKYLLGTGNFSPPASSTQ